MEAKAGERVEDLADVLAYHYSEALELALAAGGDGLADEVLPDARRMLTLAGDRMRSLDQPRADSFYRRALDLYEPDDLEQAQLLVKASRVAVTLSTPQAEADVSRAVDLYRSAGDELGLAEALLDLSRYMGYRGNKAEERAYLDEAQRLVERHPPGPAFVVLLGMRAGNDMMAGRAADCVASADAAISMANELGLSEYATRSLQFRGVARTELGDLGGLDDLRDAIEQALEGPSALAAGIGYLNLADATWASVGPQQGLELHKTAQAFAESRGLHITVMWSKAETTWMLYDLGRWDEILPIADELSAWERVNGEAQAGVMGLPYRALVLLRRGELSGAAAVVEELLPRARAAGDPQLLGPSLAVAALVSAAGGDDAAGLGLVHELEELTHDLSDRHRALFLPELTQMCVAAGAFELARDLGTGFTTDVGRVGGARVAAAAVLAEAGGETEQALELNEEAARRWQDYGFVPGRAVARLGGGRCLVALGRPGADERLAEARDLFSSLGDRNGLQETEALLAGL